MQNSKSAKVAIRKALVSMTSASLQIMAIGLSAGIGLSITLAAPTLAQGGNAPPGSFVQSTNQSQQQVNQNQIQNQYQNSNSSVPLQNGAPPQVAPNYSNQGQNFQPQNYQQPGNFQQPVQAPPGYQGNPQQSYQQPAYQSQQFQQAQQGQQPPAFQPQGGPLGQIQGFQPSGNYQGQGYQQNSGFTPQSTNAPVEGSVQQNQFDQQPAATQPAAADPNWPTEFDDNTATPTATTAEAPGQPSKAAAVGSALVKTLGTVMAARAAGSMLGGNTGMMGGMMGNNTSMMGRMLGGNNMMGSMGGLGGFGGMNGMGGMMNGMGGMNGYGMGGMMNGMGGMNGYGNPYGYNNNGGMMNLLINRMINR